MASALFGGRKTGLDDDDDASKIEDSFARDCTRAESAADANLNNNGKPRSFFGRNSKKKLVEEDVEEPSILSSAISGMFSTEASTTPTPAAARPASSRSWRSSTSLRKSGAETTPATKENSQTNLGMSDSSFAQVCVRAEQAADQQPSPSSLKQPRKPGTSCGSRLWIDLNPCQSWFTVTDKATGRKIDIPESFAPPTCLAFLWKLAMTGFCIALLIYSWLETVSAAFYMAYLTHWALLLSCLYFGMSTWNTMTAARTPQPPDSAGCRIRTTWVLFEMAAHTELVVTILYWSLIYKPGDAITFVSVAPHSAVVTAVIVDGLFVNRIPVRWTHYYGFVFSLDMLFVIWSVLHDFLHVGNLDNEYDNNPNTNDDSIYAVLSWTKDWQKTLVLCVIVVFGVGPILYLLLWMVSLYRIPCFCYKDRRIYVDSFRDESRPTVADVEEGSIFTMWKW